MSHPPGSSCSSAASLDLLLMSVLRLRAFAMSTARARQTRCVFLSRQCSSCSVPPRVEDYPSVQAKGEALLWQEDLPCWLVAQIKSAHFLTCSAPCGASCLFRSSRKPLREFHRESVQCRFSSHGWASSTSSRCCTSPDRPPCRPPHRRGKCDDCVSPCAASYSPRETTCLSDLHLPSSNYTSDTKVAHYLLCLLHPYCKE